MARQNDVRLFGAIINQPKIQKDSNGTPIRAAFNVAVIKNSRDIGEGDKEQVRYDWPMVITKDPDQCRLISKFKLYDIVEIQGTFTTMKVGKDTYCKDCGTMNRVEGNICYVNPIFIKRRNPIRVRTREDGNEVKEATTMTEAEAIQEVKENRAISNNVTIVGNLCNDVDYYKDDKTETAVYQLGIDRKFYIQQDDPKNRADYPIVKTYGAKAKEASMCIHQGTLVMVEGYLHTRRFQRKSVCCGCQTPYEWTDNIIEIIPFATEYLHDYIDPEEAEKILAEKEAALNQQAMLDFLNHG